MSRNRSLSPLAVCLTAALLAGAVLVTPASAQMNPTDPATIRVTQVKTKPGYGNVWRDMYRDRLVPYYKSAKWPFLLVYRVRFGEPNYAVVSDIGTYDMPPGESTEDGVRQFREAIRQSSEWARTYVQRKHTDLSFGQPQEAPAEHLSVSHITIAPGRRSDFIKNFKENGLPRWKKMGMPFLVTWEIIYGHNSGEFVVVTPIENYGDLANGTPFYRGMSEADRAQVLSGMQGVITNIQRSVADYMPELSFVADE